MSLGSFLVAERVVAAHAEPADQIATFAAGEARVVVADGAGNSAAGRLAAEAVVALIRGATGTIAFEPALPDSWVQLLLKCDSSVESAGHGGETTAVVVCIRGDLVIGASVGDSEAWLLTDGTTDVLTRGQQRKPLLGTGSARPVPFNRRCGAGTLLAATDGLFKYVQASLVRDAFRAANLEAVAQKLSDLPRLRSGALPDDVGLVLCRFRAEIGS